MTVVDGPHEVKEEQRSTNLSTETEQRSHKEEGRIDEPQVAAALIAPMTPSQARWRRSRTRLRTCKPPIAAAVTPAPTSWAERPKHRDSGGDESGTGTNNEVGEDKGRDRPNATDILRGCSDLREEGAAHCLLKIASAAGDFERLGFHFSKDSSQAIDRLQAANLGNVLPIQVSDPRNENGQSDSVGLDSRIACKASTDDSAMESIDAHVPATRGAQSKVLADMLDQTRPDKILRNQTVESNVLVVASLPAVSQLLKLGSHVARIAQDDPVALRWKLLLEWLQR